MYKLRFVHVILFFIFNAKCEDKEVVKSKNPLPYFRRQVEEISEVSTKEVPDKDDRRNNLVSFLVKNVKEIFDEIVETTEISVTVTRPAMTFEVTSETETEISTVTHTTDINKNVSLFTLDDKKLDVKDLPTELLSETTRRSELLNLSKDLKYLEKSEQKELSTGLPVNPFVTRMKLEGLSSESRRSCIACNNVMLENCNDPQNKIVTSVVCDRDEDLCYSQHTPFGVIDRGCFNVNYHLTTYVCSCNLCNYISISEMPYIFSTIRDWADSVIELSRTRQLRKSVFKDMSCLYCEVNTTTKTSDMLDSANCLEGNIGTLPTQVCKPNEICAVKAVRDHAYVWRGCVGSPLYNYWWTLCDTDLCNYDALVSIYDLI